MTLRLLPNAHGAQWLCDALTTFGGSVRAFVPDRFAAYARIYHPFEFSDGVAAWKELGPFGEVDRLDPYTAGEFAMNGVADDGQAHVGDLPAPIIDHLLPVLRVATTRPDECYFAVWEGFGVFQPGVRPTLHLPQRRYHVFSGSIDDVRLGFSDLPMLHQSANLWWPADRAWCVATEIDHAWSYVGASPEAIDALLANPRLEIAETTPDALW